MLKVLIIENSQPSLRLNVVSSEQEHVNFCLHGITSTAGIKE